jgi:hypothetical protein
VSTSGAPNRRCSAWRLISSAATAKLSTLGPGKVALSKKIRLLHHFIKFLLTFLAK